MKYIFKKKVYILLATIFDTVGYLFFFFDRNRRKKSLLNPRSVLLIRLDHIGDCFMATAVPKLIKENIPNVKVIFLTSSAGKALLEQNPFVDQVIVYNTSWFAPIPQHETRRFWRVARGGAPHRRAVHKISMTSTDGAAERQDPPKSALSSLMHRLKKMNIETAIGLRGDVRENMLMWLAGIPQRIGYGITGGGFLLTKEVGYRSGTHESEHTIDLLQGLGIHARSLQPQIYFSSDEEKNLEQKLSAWRVGPEEKLVGLQVDAGSRAKEWPQENLKDFLKRFGENFPQHRLVLTGGRLPEGLGGVCNTPLLNLVGKTSLRELCALMKRFACFIGADSGPTHIAVGLGVPTIFLYSGTNVYEQWKPLFENARVLRHEVPCSPCGLRVCNVAGHPCMADIKSDQVIETLKGIL